MNIVLDLDGCIAEGKHFVLPADPLVDYMALAPYDGDTVEVYNKLCGQHTVTILTSRHQEDALAGVAGWLCLNGLVMPNSIITHVEPCAKGKIARALRADHFFDDAPAAFAGAMAANVPQPWLMHNGGWVANAEYVTRRRVSSWQAIWEMLT